MKNKILKFIKNLFPEMSNINLNNVFLIEYKFH